MKDKDKKEKELTSALEAYLELLTPNKYGAIDASFLANLTPKYTLEAQQLGIIGTSLQFVKKTDEQ